MKVVSRFEATLVRLLHFFLRWAPAAPEPAPQGRRPPPKRLSRSAIALVQEALAKGMPLLLAQAGGWRRERHLRGERVVEGRLWARTPPDALGLTFSGETLRFLLWVAAPTDATWNPDPATLAVGDQTLLYFAYAALRGDSARGDLDLASRPAFVRHGLCRLAFADDFAPETELRPDFAPWTSGVGACVLEALQPELAARWLEMERGKETVVPFSRMRDLGRSQEAVLGHFLDALTTAQRRDLARFLLRTAAELLTPGAAAEDWVGGLQTPPGARMAERLETYRAAAAFLRAVDRLAAWTDQARRIGYLDDGYAASQLWLADWERSNGDACLVRARQIIGQLDPLRREEGQSLAVPTASRCAKACAASSGLTTGSARSSNCSKSCRANRWCSCCARS